MTDRSGPPILEFDPAPTAIIEPSEMIEAIDVPIHAVLCFFQDVIERVVAEHEARIVDHVVSEIGRNPIFELELEGRRLALVHPGVGAPLAAGFLEELIARGCRAFVACGGAGVLVPTSRSATSWCRRPRSAMRAPRTTTCLRVARSRLHGKPSTPSSRRWNGTTSRT